MLQGIDDVSAWWSLTFEVAFQDPDDEFTICFSETLVKINMTVSRQEKVE
ncbi:MAG TPA: hypothetical protein VKI61_11830 [Chitinophagaceae bacterium]|jgi:hypothetical protein|nr:hypothetical protein [Chitinophagaceae bacterium]